MGEFSQETKLELIDEKTIEKYVDPKIEEIDAREHNLKWVEYVRSKQNFYQDGRFISKKHVWAGMAVKVFVIHRGEIVVAKIGNEIVPVKIKQRFATALSVTRLKNGLNETATISYSDISTDPMEVKSVLDRIHKNCPDYCTCGMPTGFETDFYNPAEFGLAMGFAETALFQVIRVGQYVEVQLPESPELVALAQVRLNFRGVLLLSYGTTERWFHMLDAYVHQVGWVEKQQKNFFKEFSLDVTYVSKYENQLIATAKKKAAPSFLFRENIIYPHRLQSGDIVVVGDDYMASWWLAHVITNHNKHFFNLMIGDSFVMNPMNNLPFEFHVYHRRIFSYSLAKSIGLQIRTPLNLQIREDEGDLAAYQRKYTAEKITPGTNLGCHYQFDTFVQHMTNDARNGAYEDMSELRFLEVMRITPSGQLQMCAAEVTGHRRHVYRIRVNGDDHETYAHYFDPFLFHMGSCLDLDIPIKFDKKFFIELDKEKRNKTKQKKRAFEPF